MHGLNSNPKSFGGSTPVICSCGESCLLVSLCAGDRCDMAGSDEDRCRSRRSSIEDQRWLHRPGTRWLDDQKVG
jgi:hypothetical protein